MWKLSILLLALACSQAIAEDPKHNLPDNLEIIDPKSLGLSDSDVEKFLGNVKLLPVGGNMGNNVKTQILTVGFDGDEKLDLSDFELPQTQGLPDKDKEVAEQAFKRFQEFFKKPDSSVDFDKVIADSENSAEKNAYETTVARQPETTTPGYTEGVTNFRNELTRTTAQAPFRSTGPTSQPTGPQYDVNAQEVINLLKVSNGQRFGGFLSGNQNQEQQQQQQQFQQTQTTRGPENQYQSQPSTSDEQIFTKAQDGQSFEEQNFIVQPQQQFQQNQGPQQIQIPLAGPPRGQTVGPFIPPNVGPQQPVFIQQQLPQFNNHGPNHETQGPPQPFAQAFTQTSLPPKNGLIQVQNFPQVTPVHAQFQPPEQFAKNFIPVHGPQHSVPSTPRPGFSVTPSTPMIPLSTVENAISRPPVVPQHLHPVQQHQNLRNGKENPDSISHEDIVAKIAREQHLRIAQQPAQIPTHPPPKAQGNQQGNQQQPQQHQHHQGRELSQEPLKHQQHQQHNQQQFAQPPPLPPQPFSHTLQQSGFQQQRNPGPPPTTYRPTFTPPQYTTSQRFPPPPPSPQPSQPIRHNNQQSQQFPPPQRPQNFQQPPPFQPPRQNNFQRPPQYTPQFRQPNFPPHNRFQSQPSSSSNNAFSRPPIPQPPPPPSNSNYLTRPIPNTSQQPQATRPTPVSHVFFPPARQNLLFKESSNRFNNRPPPPPPHRPQTNPAFNPSTNLIPVDQPIIKNNGRFQSRPDPASFSSSSNSISGPSAFAPPPRSPLPPSRYNSFGERPPSRDESQRGPRHFTNFGFGPSPYSGPTHYSRGPPPQSRPHTFSSIHDLSPEGSAPASSLAITKDLFKPDFIHSIQPSKMVAYKYISSGENN